MLTQLSTRSFKSWEHIDRMRLAPITGFFGTNSSGKSSILQLLLLIKQTIESSDRAAVLEFGDDRSLTYLGNFRDVVFGHVEHGTLEFALSWDLGKPRIVRDPASEKRFSFRDMSFRVKLEQNNDERLTVVQFSYDVASHRFSMRRTASQPRRYELICEEGDYDLLRTRGRPWALPAPVKFYGFPDRVFTDFQNASFLAELQLVFEELFARLYYLGPLRDFPKRHYTWAGSEPADMGRRGERVVDALLASRHRGKYISPGPHKRRQSLEERIAFWLKELGLIHDFSVEPIAEGSNLYHVHIQSASGAAEVLLPDVGFGVSQVLPVLVLCYYVPEGSTILLEQPEIHLHPSVQMGLADVLIDAAKNRNIQIILESHSEHLLRRLQRRIADKTIPPSKAALYFCNVAEGGSSLTPLNLDLFGNITNWPKDFFGDEFGEMAAATEEAMKRRQSAI